VLSAVGVGWRMVEAELMCGAYWLGMLLGMQGMQQSLMVVLNECDC